MRTPRLSVLAGGLLLAVACGPQLEPPDADTATTPAALTISGSPTVTPPVALNLPNAPNLFGPLDGFVIVLPNGVPMRTFTWDPPVGGRTPAFYIFWLEEAVATGGFKTTPVELSYWPGRTSTDQLIPLALADRPARWYVAGCTARIPALLGGFTYACGPAASRSITWSTQSPAPAVMAPADGARVEPAAASFSWWGVNAISSYRLCVARTGVSCPDQPISNDNVVVVSLTGTSITADLSRFRGQTVSWTAAACNSAGQCSYRSPPRSVRVDETPPSLDAPANGATVASLPTLSWRPVSWRSYYLVCVSTPGTDCLNREVRPGENPDVVVVRTNDTHVGTGGLWPVPIDLYQFKGMTVNWTVAGCISSPTLFGAPYCSWQTERRTMRVVPEWSVGARLDSLEVRDDCDSVSPGDWRVRFGASAHEGLVPKAIDWFDWPTSNAQGSRDVDSGTSLAIGQGVGVTVHESDTVTLAGAAIDCDNDGLWTLTNVYDGVEGVWNTIENWTQTCGGEEIYESSGDNDRVGTFAYTFGPRDWMAARNLAVSVTSPGGYDCGSNPYTAHLTVTSVRQ